MLGNRPGLIGFFSDGEPSLSDVPGSLFGRRRHRHAAGEIGVMLGGGRPAIGRENANQHLGLSVL
jgi:hypothetical protein